MKRHKQIWVVFLFMLLFVQSGYYFSASQKPAGHLGSEGESFSSKEKGKKTAVIAPLTVKDVKLFWTKEKRAHFSFPDFSQKTSYIETGASEEKYYECKDHRYFSRQEKYELTDGLRAPPGADHTAAKTA